MRTRVRVRFSSDRLHSRNKQFVCQKVHPLLQCSMPPCFSIDDSPCGCSKRKGVAGVQVPTHGDVYTNTWLGRIRHPREPPVLFSPLCDEKKLYIKKKKILNPKGNVHLLCCLKNKVFPLYF
ncbi:hypothetical protein POVWA2_020070 [Plasmodium ovale wallikeri]|uniref:Uncharacterized protein n=1 Tax=Plasmodium ovale wallikeri TaxID=864142 RepID=A0A1A8YQU4_PLAOA|nr:hypothetical protein POVWA1_019880 [Plasmodium ovale wallikeri]SBT34515.1 hypothetical protein POVWA2_020070 [Plasmodium ovale wallikeri]